MVKAFAVFGILFFLVVLSGSAEAQVCWGVKSFERTGYDSVKVVLASYACEAEAKVDTLRFRTPVEARAAKAVEIKKLVAAPFPEIQWGEKAKLNPLMESVSRFWYGVIPGESLLVGYEWWHMTWGYALGPKRAFVGFTFRTR